MSESKTANEITPFDSDYDETRPAYPVVMDEDERFIADLTAERNIQYCSMIPKNEEEEMILFNAMNNPEKRIADCVNMTIEVKHVFVEVVTCHNERTGEETVCPRTVLINSKGEGYVAVSLGIFSALKKIFKIKGTPDTWKKPVKLQVQQISKGDRRLLTFKMVK